MLFQEAKLPTSIQLNALIAYYCVNSAQLVHLNGYEPRTDILSEPALACRKFGLFHKTDYR